MTDIELLELAAKAAGIYLVWSTDPEVSPRRQDTQSFWNPLIDDGDALRLAVKLEMLISHRTMSVDVARGLAGASEYVPTYSDRCEATRRTIVRAAAEIGRALS